MYASEHHGKKKRGEIAFFLNSFGGKYQERALLPTRPFGDFDELANSLPNSTDA